MIKRVKCPKCGREVEVDIDEAVAQARASPLKMTAVALPHGDHHVIVYVDDSGGIRGVEWAAAPSKPLVNMLEEVPVPAERMPDIRALSKEELRVLVMCDGKRTLREISRLLGIPLPQLRIIAERLRAYGYLKDVEVRVV